MPSTQKSTQQMLAKKRRQKEIGTTENEGARVRHFGGEVWGNRLIRMRLTSSPKCLTQELEAGRTDKGHGAPLFKTKLPSSFPSGNKIQTPYHSLPCKMPTQ